MGRLVEVLAVLVLALRLQQARASLPRFVALLRRQDLAALAAHLLVRLAEEVLVASLLHC